MQDPAPNLLESWKEIAAFLGRDKRTAMRWAEDHAMPVHRYPGSKQARVFAYRDQLAAWLASFDHPELERASGNGSGTNAQNHENHTQVQQDVAGAVAARDSALSAPERYDSPQSRSVASAPPPIPTASPLKPEQPGAKSSRLTTALWLRRRSIAAVTGILVLAIGAVASLQPGARFTSGIKAVGLVQLTEDGRYKSGLSTDGATLFFQEQAGLSNFLASTPIEGGPVRQIPTPFGNGSLQDVSRDGKTLLLTAREGIEPSGELWKLPAQGGTPTRVGQIHCASARWSPDGKQIAFGAENSLYITDAEGHAPHLIASFETTPGQFVWSPNGHQLRYFVEDKAKGELSGWEIDPNAAPAFNRSVPRKLSLGSPCCAAWTWLGDSKDFAYVLAQTDDGTHFNLTDQRLVLSGWLGTRREFSLNVGQVLALASGKDSSRLYFLISNAVRGELLRYDSSQKVFQSYLPGLSAQYLSFSRDRQWLNYAMTQDSSLWRSRADGTQALRIVGPPMTAQLSAWSPDGRQIAFMGRLPGKHWRIYLVGRDGGTPREAASGDDNQGAPTWSPDGKTIAYGRVNCESDNSCGIFLLDLETGRTQLLPESEKLRTARWSPDGRYIAALQRDTQTVQLFDPKKHKWQKLAENVPGDDLSWSKDSRTLYVSCLNREKPTIDKVRISDRTRSTAVDLTPLQKMPGQLRMWFGLTPDDSPILIHLYTSSEVYAMDLNKP